MSRRGRPKTPSELKVARGTHRPDRDGELESQVRPVGDLPPIPDWLGEHGRQAWSELVASLPDGMLTAADAHMLAQYASLHDRFHEARKIVEKDGYIAIGEKGGPYQHPAVGMMSAATRDMHKFASMFGLSPSDRVHLPTPVPDKQKGVATRQRA